MRCQSLPALVLCVTENWAGNDLKGEVAENSLSEHCKCMALRISYICKIASTLRLLYTNL